MRPNYDDLVSSYIEEAIDKDIIDPLVILEYVKESVYQYAIDNDDRFDEEWAHVQVKDEYDPVGAEIAQALKKVIGEAEEIIAEIRHIQRFGRE